MVMLTLVILPNNGSFAQSAEEPYFGKINPFSDQSKREAEGIVISELIVKHLFLFRP